MMLEVLHRNGLHLVEAPGLEMELGVRVTFTGRCGGASGGPFSSFNLSYNVGDSRNDVTTNRDRLGEAIGIATQDWVLCRQVHGARVSVVQPLDVGRGASDFLSAIPRSDGLATRMERVVLAVLTADCAPVIMVAPGGSAVAVAHVGWRGALAGTAAVALGKLTGIACCSPGDVVALIGPHIGPCCMEVGGEVAERFRARFGDEVVAGSGGSGAAVDLGAACHLQLAAAGVSGGNIFDVNICTRCDDRYFSYRGSSGTTGRQAGLVAILGGPKCPAP